MLMTFRKHAKYFYVLFGIVILSFLGWGVGTNDQGTNQQVVASVGKEDITLEEYSRTYDRTVEVYREMYKEKFDDKMREQLKLGVLGSMIERKVLYIAAVDAGIKVSDAELMEAIYAESAFHRNGAFDAETYHNRLRLSRLTPKYYEENRRKDLIVEKFTSLVTASVEVYEADLRLGSGINLDPKTMAEFRKGMLDSKREYAIQSYVEGLKKVMDIKINQALIS